MLDCRFVDDGVVLLLPTWPDCCPCAPISVELLPSATEVMPVSGGVRSVPGLPVNWGVELDGAGLVFCVGKFTDELADCILVIVDGGTNRGGEPDCCGDTCPDCSGG